MITNFKIFEGVKKFKIGDIVQVYFNNKYYYGYIEDTYKSEDFYDVVLDDMKSMPIPVGANYIKKLNSKELKKYKLEQDLKKYNL